MATKETPQYNYERFKWQQSTTDPLLYTRQAAGGEVIEDVWNRLKAGDQTLFLGLDISLDSASVDGLVNKAARNSWLWLRTQVPIIAAHTELDDEGNTLMTYRSPAGVEDAEKWVDRTFFIHEDVIELDELRYKLGPNPVPDEHGNQTWLHLIHAKNSGGFRLLFHTHHTPFDGSGIKIVMNTYLKHLAQSLVDSDNAGPFTFTWGEEAKNLNPVIYHCIDNPAKDPLSGLEYAATLQEVLGSLQTHSPNVYGFKQRSTGLGKTKRIGFTFSLDKSTQILDAVRKLGFTITHVAHAAVSMIVLMDNPPTPETPSNAVFLYYGLVDGRKRLAPPFNARDGYPGYCLAMTPIVIPVSTFAGVDLTSRDVHVLIPASRMIKEAYAHQRELSGLLSIGAQEAELMMQPLKVAKAEADKAGRELTLPAWMGPWFSGDGTGETYLDVEFMDSAGKKVFAIDDFFVSINKQDPGPFFRITSWKGRIMLSVDFNEDAMPAEDVQRFMKNWEQLLCSVV